MLIISYEMVSMRSIFTCLQEVNRSGRTKEDIQMMNLKKKTRKRTRKFEIDGVVVTTTTSKVIYGDEENGKVYDDHIFRYNLHFSNCIPPLLLLPLWSIGHP